MEKVRYVNDKLGIYGVWSGGPYIDIFLEEADIPFHTVDVFDYEAGEVTDAQTRENAIQEYFDELERIYLS